ncbi:hypothetical protein [Streptomyces sp. NPDC059003]|uniref:hypothetical protein n=1 Tax=Streptomyces sp. NPDC059003 TaxID=3346691 RepID=UPI00368EBA1A
MRTVPLAWLYEIGTEVVVTAPCPARGASGVVIGYGPDFGFETDYAVEMDCGECPRPCVGRWNHGSLTRWDGGGEGPDDRLPPPVVPGATIPLVVKIGLAA